MSLSDTPPGGAGTASLEALYQEQILEHYRHPRNKRVLAAATGSASISNPLCGDHITVSVRMVDGVVEDASFQGSGCSIAQAAASMLTDLVLGATQADTCRIGESFEKMISGEVAAAELPELGDLLALSGVTRFLTRRKCALIPWRAMEEAMRKSA